jgi:CheY-like chemotaxis protein
MMRNSTLFLLVDDDADDIIVFKEVLRDVNPSIQLIEAGDGLEALEILRSRHDNLPDIIFLDLNMPRMQGKECLVEIKKDPHLQHIPVIIYTTSSLSRDIEDSMLKGAVCFITKPSSLKELRHIVSSISQNVHGDLGRCLRVLSNTSTTFIVC